MNKRRKKSRKSRGIFVDKEEEQRKAETKSLRTRAHVFQEEQKRILAKLNNKRKEKINSHVH